MGSRSALNDSLNTYIIDLDPVSWSCCPINSENRENTLGLGLSVNHRRCLCSRRSSVRAPMSSPSQLAAS